MLQQELIYHESEVDVTHHQIAKVITYELFAWYEPFLLIIVDI